MKVMISVLFLNISKSIKSQIKESEGFSACFGKDLLLGFSFFSSSCITAANLQGLNCIPKSNF